MKGGKKWKITFFDFDGTLADTRQVVVAAVQDSFTQFGLTQPDSVIILGYIGVPPETSFPQMGADLPPEKLATLCQFFRQAYSQHASEIELFAGISEVLGELQAQGKRLFIITSKTNTALRESAELLGILDYFEDVIGCDDVENYKPDPDGIELLVKRYDLEKAASVMIGDAIYDIQMGQAAGVATCGVKWGSQKWTQVQALNPTYQLTDPAEILKL